MFDAIYYSFARNLRWTPRQVDELEVWEAALLLGAAGPPAAIAATNLVSRRRSVDGQPPPVTLGADKSRQ